MATLYEGQWNPVNVGTSAANNKEPYKISTTNVSSSWYNRLLDGSGIRRVRLSHFYEMDKTVEISKALDVLAEDISSENADHEEAVELNYDENKKYLKSTIKLIEDAKDLWMTRTKFDEKLFERVRETLQYGASFYKENDDGSLRRIPPERIVGYICDDSDEDLITHYIEDPNVTTFEFEYNNRSKARVDTQTKRKNELVTHPIDTLLIFKVGDGPYGQSVLECVYKVWRQMTLIEDSIVIYRVTRSSEKRVYYIDVGNLSGPRRQQAIEQQRIRLMQKKNKSRNMEGGIDSEYDPQSTTEDIFIPTNSQGKGSRVETLQGGQNLGEITDVTYFLKKLASGLRIPNSMIDSMAEQDRNQFNDARVGTIYAAEMRYLGHVKRIARVFSKGLNRSFYHFCKKRGVIVPEGMYIKLSDPNSFAKYKDMEVWQQQMNIYQSAQQINTMSKRNMLKKFLFMDEEEMAENEEMKLIEMGATEDQIKTMPQNDVINLVYGNKSVAEKYGLQADEDMGRGRF